MTCSRIEVSKSGHLRPPNCHFIVRMLCLETPRRVPLLRTTSPRCRCNPVKAPPGDPPPPPLLFNSSLVTAEAASSSSSAAGQAAPPAGEWDAERAKKLLYCSLCKVSVNSLMQLEAHNSGQPPRQLSFALPGVGGGPLTLRRGGLYEKARRLARNAPTLHIAPPRPRLLSRRH